MTARSTRRAAERKAKKAARKAQNQSLHSPYVAPAPEPDVAPKPAEPEHESTPGTAPSTSQARLDANRANAQLSTGPRTVAGKAISSQNRLTHGLVYNDSNFRVLPCEDQSAFNGLHQTLCDEQNPTTPSESLLVQRMAHHEWLYRRALRLQESCFNPETGEVADPKLFSLYMRYVSAHERGFVRCLHELAKSRKDRQNLAIGFEREKRTQQLHRADLVLKEMAVDQSAMRTRQLCRTEFGPGTCPHQEQESENTSEALQTAA